MLCLYVSAFTIRYAVACVNAFMSLMVTMLIWQLSIEDIALHAGLYEETSAFSNLQVCYRQQNFLQPEL